MSLAKLQTRVTNFWGRILMIYEQSFQNFHTDCSSVCAGPCFSKVFSAAAAAANDI